ncbi:sensor histidine kinase [Clostridium sp.]|uniref:sensor histidine kinase n=1 Tax=Clostridium sp. TaxID=1506 RepID=UPI002FC5CCCF
MRKSIKSRLLINFTLIIVSMVIILELLFINTVKGNYYKNIEENLLSQIKVSSDLYLKYSTDSSLYENVLNNVDTFWRQTTAQVQIIDLNGKVIMDSIGAFPKNALEYEDVSLALKGQTGTWVGKTPYDGEESMAVSYPLKSSTEQVGVIRFITSLKEINIDISRITFIFVLIGILATMLGILVIYVLTKTITGPLNEVTKVASIMAKGDFKVKSKKYYEDEIGKLSDTLNFLSDEIIKKDDLKNDFISSVSHELRTPLTSIKGWAITLKEFGSDKEMLSDGLDIIEKESDRLSGMVEELLDFSKFVSGKITLNLKTINVENITEHIKKQYTPRAIRSSINFIESHEDLPNIISDENRLKQVFINILDNAFKFTPEKGTIEFTSKVVDNSIEFTIKDTGCGISKEDLPKVKEKFFKGKTSKSQNGIGLSICDEIITLMNGKFIIESELDVGTTIRIIIPIMQEG